MPNSNTVEVFCTLKVEGIHFWPDCPIEEVSYLRDPHRHLFGIKAFKTVYHDDRDVEFIWFKHQIQHYIDQTYYNGQYKCCLFGAMSCEMLAQELIEKFDLSRCEVDEDGENGAIVTVRT